MRLRYPGGRTATRGSAAAQGPDGQPDQADEHRDRDDQNGHDRDDDPAALEPPPAVGRGRRSAGERCPAGAALLAAALGEVARLVTGVAGDRAEDRLRRGAQDLEVGRVEAVHRLRGPGRWRRCGGCLGRGGSASASTASSPWRACSAVLRSAGSLVSSPRSTGSSGPARTVGAGCSDTTDIAVAIGSPRPNGGGPPPAPGKGGPRPPQAPPGPGGAPPGPFGGPLHARAGTAP